MENIKNITIEDVKNDDKLLEKIIKYYNTYITSQNKYRLANKEKLNEYMKNYYYKKRKATFQLILVQKMKLRNLYFIIIKI